jgi:hypothetical protein
MASVLEHLALDTVGKAPARSFEEGDDFCVIAPCGPRGDRVPQVAEESNRLPRTSPWRNGRVPDGMRKVGFVCCVCHGGISISLAFRPN